MKYFLITNRTISSTEGPGSSRSGLSYWVCNAERVDAWSNWQRLSKTDLRKELLEIISKFPAVPEESNEEQKHLGVFIHGYNNEWSEAALKYQTVQTNVYGKSGELGQCVLFSWPSNGSVAGYLPDRADARESALDLADVLDDLYEYATMMQQKAVASPNDPNKQCRAKVSVIAHSMGNYALQKAMQLCWTRRNQPALMSLVNQLVLVAADVDNDLFDLENAEETDGSAMANLSYRISALFTGRDSVLGMSAGLKHFGKRRLGRSGLARPDRVYDNVHATDCTSLISSNESDIHSCYFQQPKTVALMQSVLRGVDRNLLLTASTRGRG